MVEPHGDDWKPATDIAMLRLGWEGDQTHGRAIRRMALVGKAVRAGN
jgi:hypothetical protein